MQLPLNKIRLDGDTQSRASLNHEAVAEYRETIERSGGRWCFDPLVVFHDGSHYWLADGFHRWHASKEAGLKKVSVAVHQGSKRDAFLFAAKSNTEHGLRRTNADKRFIVARFLNDATWGKRSDRWIADAAMVSHEFVRTTRKQVTTQTATVNVDSGKVGKDGRKQTRIRRKKKTVPVITTEAEVGHRDEPEPEEPPQGRGLIESFKASAFYREYAAANETARHLFRVYVWEELT